MTEDALFDQVAEILEAARSHEFLAVIIVPIYDNNSPRDIDPTTVNDT
jgi:hypothetical protein